MKTPFKTLLGSRLVIANFLTEQKEESKIELLDSTKAEVDAQKLESTQRFTILQVGTECSEHFKEGQEIYIESPERVLHPENAETIIEDDQIVGFIIPERQVAAIF
jgi:hypothetical protein